MWIYLSKQRYFFPNYSPFKKIVEESFLLSLREVYMHHPLYTYHDDETQSELLIMPSYANSRVDGKKPKFVTRIGSYTKEMHDTLSNNFSENVMNAKGGVIGKKRFKIITVPITVMIHAYAEEQAAELADELTDTVIFFAQGVFSGTGLLVKGAHVSETDIYKEESGLYQTVVTFTFDVPWSFTKINEEMIDGFQIGGSVNGGPCKERPGDSMGGLDIDFEFDGYRKPGITIFRHIEEDLYPQKPAKPPKK